MYAMQTWGDYQVSKRKTFENLASVVRLASTSRAWSPKSTGEIFESENVILEGFVERITFALISKVMNLAFGPTIV